MIASGPERVVAPDGGYPVGKQSRGSYNSPPASSKNYSITPTGASTPSESQLLTFHGGGS